MTAAFSEPTAAIKALTKIVERWLEDGGIREVTTTETESIRIGDDGLEEVVGRDIRTVAELKPVPQWVFDRMIGPQSEGLKLILWAIQEGRFASDLDTQRTVTGFLYRHIPFLANNDEREWVMEHKRDLDQRLELEKWMKRDRPGEDEGTEPEPEPERPDWDWDGGDDA